MRKPTRQEAASRRRELREAAQVIIDRHFPPTLGPCHYCEYPVTNCYFGPTTGGAYMFEEDEPLLSAAVREMVPTCTLCHHLLDNLKLHRIFEHEEPACAI